DDAVFERFPVDVHGCRKRRGRGRRRRGGGEEQDQERVRRHATVHDTLAAMTPLLLAVALETVYRVNPAKADAGFDLKATLHTVHGHTNQVKGEVRVQDGPGGVLTLSGKIEVVAATLDTDNS